MRIAGLALDDSLRIGKLVIEAYKRLAIGIIALDGGVDMIERIMVAALTIFCLMVNRG
jgi:hypothetical protein